MIRAEFWERAACGGAVGGIAVWGLAAAARVGWLRALLDLYPRAGWDRVTWVLIPVLLMLPLIAQGTAAALLSPWRPIPAGRGIVGSLAGSALALGALGVVLLFAFRPLPILTGGAASRVLPVPLILGCGALLIAGWLAIRGRSLASRWPRRAAVPAALVAVLAAWIFARGWVLAASYVLDRAEVMAFFVAVAAGGGVGSAWTVRPRDDAN